MRGHATAQTISFSHTHRECHGVEPICTVPRTAPSTYYAASRRQPSRGEVEGFKVEILWVHEENLGVYGVDKVWRQLGREGIRAGRDRVARLMQALGLRGVARGRTTRTTISKQHAGDRPDDLVKRRFTASAPNRLWVADTTYVWTWLGFVYTAFVIAVFSRPIVGWKVSTSLTVAVALDALEMALWQRWGDGLGGLIHHSDRGVQYTAIRYTQRLEDAGAVPSVGSKGAWFPPDLLEIFRHDPRALTLMRVGEVVSRLSQPPETGVLSGSKPGSANGVLRAALNSRPRAWGQY